MFLEYCLTRSLYDLFGTTIVAICYKDGDFLVMESSCFDSIPVLILFSAYLLCADDLCRNESVMADCGADGLICILDMRLSEPLVISIDTDNATGVNVAEWCPSQENLLLSASKDPHICLYDIRNPNKYLHKLCGHIDPKLQKCSHIYRPTFVDQGRVVASPGQGSKAISLYCVETGKAISRGHLGYDPNMVLWSSCGLDNSPSLWVASKSISQLIPLYSNVSG